MHVGGAEVNLLRSVQPNDIIITVYGDGVNSKFRDYVSRTNIVFLNSRSIFQALLLLSKKINSVSGDVLELHCWLSPSIVITHLATLFFSNKKITYIWQIRSLPTWFKLRRVISNIFICFFSLINKPVLVFNSYSSKEKYWFLWYSRVEVSWNAIDPEQIKYDEYSVKYIRSKLSIRPESVVFLCVGRNVIEKNYNRFMAAVVEASHTQGFANGVLIFVGRDCTRLKLSNRDCINERLSIHLIEHVDDVSVYYGVSDIICVPSISESCSNALLEGMHCGLSPLISNAGDNELIANTKGFDPYNIKEIASFVNKAYIDVKRRKSL